MEEHGLDMGARGRLARIDQGQRGRSRPRQVYYVLTETPCPYLPSRRERKLMTEVRGPQSDEVYSLLSQAGFRRSHNFAYRPACQGCSACVAVRIPVADFDFSKSLRRIWKANQDLSHEIAGPLPSREQFRVFARYVRSRHGDGEMAAMTWLDYCSMVQETRLDTHLHLYRDGAGSLVAACLTDHLTDGYSAVYSFFDPSLSRRSLGTMMILSLVSQAASAGLSHVYLGYWVPGSRKMAYKERFRPLEAFIKGKWQVLDPDHFG